MTEEVHCLDEIGFRDWLGTSTDPNLDISKLIDLADSIFARNKVINVSNNLEDININSSLKFYDLYSFDFSDSDIQDGLSRDSIQRLIPFLGRLNRIDVKSPPVATLKNLDNTLIKTENNWHSVGMMEEVLVDQEVYSLIVIGNSLSEVEHIIETTTNHKRVFILQNLESLPNYFRTLLLRCRNPEDTFFFHWDNAFPKLIKSDDLTFRRFHGDSKSVLQDVVKHLSFLNDDYLNLQAQCNNNFPEIITRAKTAHEINLSNESPNTRKSPTKMKQREAKFSGEVITCECHTKISPTSNRIHFHTPVDKIDANKMLIGIFVDHLDV